VQNIGSADATGVATVLDTVPAGLTINSAGPGCSIAGQAVTCTIAAADLQLADPAVAITINVTPMASVNGTTLSNVTSVTGGGDPGCVDADDCESTPVETDVGAPELTITKTGPSTAVVGVAFDYTLTVDNIGTADATAAATVIDTVPTGLTINS